MANLNSECYKTDLMKRYPKKEKVAKELVSAFRTINSVENKMTFAQLCDWWCRLRKEKIDYEQYWIGIIDEAYKEYLELGEKGFIEKYSK